MKVLIADDDPMLRELLGGVLLAAGYEVVTASNGLEAWEILQRDHVRMLLVDWMMPGLDGPELIRRLRAAGSRAYTYAVLLTAMNGREAVVAGLLSGADDYVTKPFREEELLARLAVGARILALESGLAESLAREEALSSLDALTGLPNRRALQFRALAELTRAEREGTSVGFVMMDIDHFKAINDRFGHAAGDDALRQVAVALQKNRRDYDFPGRWGGEEFLIVVPGASLEQAAGVAERVRAAVELVQLNGVCELRASLGVTAASPRSRPAGLEELLGEADEALYRAKATGRNRVCLHSPPTAT